MQVLISGSHGLIGSAIAEALTARGDTVRRLVRSEPVRPGDVLWKPTGDAIDRGAMAGIDAVVHLAGESIFGLWTAAKRREIRDSRVLGTRLLAEAIAALEPRPRVLVTASAVGYYGDRGDELLTEEAAPGAGFLADVVVGWEAATAPAADAGVRVVSMRTGIVQTTLGGMLQMVKLPFSLGLGGRLGSGRQWFSWISLDDLVAAYLHAIDAPTLSGPVNATAPEPVTNREYTKTLGRVLRRPTVLPVPRAALAALPGGSGRELLGSQRVVPRRLLDDGFAFAFPTLDAALRHELGR